MLEREFQYYKAHESELVKEHNGKFVAIVGEEVVGVFDTELAAYVEMKKRFKAGEFLIQQCLPIKENLQRYRSRVAFHRAVA